MAIDNLVLKTIAKDLNDELTGAFFDKPFSLGESQFALPYHGGHNEENGGRGTLIIALNPSNPFLCYSYDRFMKVNLNTPFFNSLKDLAGCRIKAISKFEGERIITIETEVASSFIDSLNTGYDLVIEVFPQCPNCYLIPQPYNKITSLYKQSEDVFKERYMSRGLPYIPPVQRESLSANDTTLEKALSRLSHSTSRLFSDYAAKIGFEKALNELLKSNSLYMIDKTIEPLNFGRDDALKIKTQDIYSFYVKDQSTLAHSLSISSLLDEIKKSQTNAIRKKKHLEDDLQAAKQRLVYKDYGQELYLHQTELAPNALAADFDGYHIPLRKDLSAIENANAYFKRYRKAKTASEILLPLIDKTESEITYLSNKLLEADKGNGEDILQLKAELAEAGYLKVKKNQHLPSAKKISASEPHYLKNSEYKIGFGMNAFQNEKLTFEIAKATDSFLHVKDYPGAHVVILAGESEKTVLLAAELALFLSDLDAGDVMIAPIRRVKKNKAQRGLVSFLEYKLITIHKIRPESIDLFRQSLKLS